jgi:hypothetical protein
LDHSFSRSVITGSMASLQCALLSQGFERWCRGSKCFLVRNEQ